MKPRPGEGDHEYLERVLAELLDYYPGALVLVKDISGGAIVVAGGASDGEDAVREYQELISAAPGIIRLWGDNRQTPEEFN